MEYVVGFVRAIHDGIRAHYTFEKCILNTDGEITMMDIKNTKIRDSQGAMGARIYVAYFHKLGSATL